MGLSSFEDVANQFAEKTLKDDVLVRNIHLDLNSYEESTGEYNDKYKLLIKRFLSLGIYFFYVLTKRESACPHRAKITLTNGHFDFKKGNHLKLQNSYINLERPFVEDKISLINKIRKSENNFECVARITQSTLSDISSKAKEIGTDYILDDKTREIISASFGLDDISDDFIKKYGI